MRFDTIREARRFAGRVWARPSMAVLAVALLTPLSACNLDETLSVDDPDVVKPSNLNDKSALPAILAGAQSEFQVAFLGNNGGDSQITMSGLLTDELYDIDTFPTRVEVDQRNMQNTNGTLLGPYASLHQARAAAEKGAAAYARLEPNTAPQSELHSIAGFSYVIFGENYCSGVPFSQQNDAGVLEYGEPQTTVEIFTAAVAKFDSAITVAGAVTGATGTARANLARVGKGRALLNLGQFAAAATAVTAVPTTFVHRVETSENSGRQNNSVYRLTSAIDPRYAGAKGEGTNGLNFIDLDPRARSIRPGSAVGQDGFNPAFFQQKYLSRTAPVTLADGIEARLIEAEAAMQANDLTTFRTKLNDARATRTDLPAFTAGDIPADRAGQVNLLFRERAYWMWLTSHRLGDMRRLIRQYGRNAETVFPTGPYVSLINKGGGRYFSDVNFPIPFNEQNNPNFTQCLDRAA